MSEHNDRKHRADIVTWAAPTDRTARMAYLTNLYPKQSHTFIRDEIAMLEQQGFAVERFSIRPGDATLVDASDRRELDVTTALLRPGDPRFFGDALLALLRAPVRWLRTLSLALREGRSGAGIPTSIAYFLEACRLAMAMRRQGIRHVHVHFGTNPATVARLAHHLDGIGYSLTIHGPDEFDAPRQLLLREKMADARFTVAISHHGKAQLVRWSNSEDWSRIHVVRCGVTDHFLGAEPVEIAAASRRFVCVARLSAQKGLGVLIDAATLLAKNHMFELRLIGDGEMRDAIVAMIADRGLERHIRLLGWCDARTIRDELNGCRALVLPSFAEGLPVVLMEALALGRPVVTTSVAGITELVDAQCGWVVPPAAPERLAQAMAEALLADPDRLRRMGRVGRERVRRDHDARKNAAQLGRLLTRHL